MYVCLFIFFSDNIILKNTFVSVLRSYKLTSEIPVVNCSFILIHHVNIFWFLLPCWHLQTLLTRLKYVDIGNKQKNTKKNVATQHISDDNYERGNPRQSKRCFVYLYIKMCLYVPVMKLLILLELHVDIYRNIIWESAM